jgi:hypothetical protein
MDAPVLGGQALQRVQTWFVATVGCYVCSNTWASINYGVLNLCPRTWEYPAPKKLVLFGESPAKAVLLGVLSRFKAHRGYANRDELDVRQLGIGVHTCASQCER